MPLSIWIVAVALPLVVGAVAVAVQLAWLPQLPDPVAIHWGVDGPDGFGAAWTNVALTGGVTLGLTALFAVFLASARGAAPTATHKLLAVMSLAVAVFLGVTVTASLGVQRGLDDARDASGIDAWLGIALAAAVVVGVVAWFALPKSAVGSTDAVPAEPLSLAPGERSAWIATARMPTGAVVGIVGVLGALLALTSFAVVLTDGTLWPIALVPLLLLVMCAVGITWRVRADASGLLVRSLPFGWPRVRILIGDIASVQTIEVEPLADFGGWGWRWGPGRGFGVVARAGEAIQVTRRDGRRFIVTVDDAATGAALLAGYASATGTGERGPQGGSARQNG
jgi:hypothetical protein